MRLVRNHGVTAPAGFRAGVGEDGRVALVVNEGPDLSAAGRCTTDEDKAAAVLWTEQVLTTGRLRAVLVHRQPASGTVSADFGLTHRLAEQVATTLSDWGSETGAGEIAVCQPADHSGAVAADELSADALLEAAREAVHELAGGIVGGTEAARSIAGGEAGVQVAAQHQAGWTLGGLTDARGAVSVFTTDAVAGPRTLREALDRIAWKLTGPRATVLLLASGASEVVAEPAELADAVTAVDEDLRRPSGQPARGTADMGAQS